MFTAKEVPYATYQSNLQNDPNASLALPAPTGTVTVFDGSTIVGSATLSAAGKTGMELLSIPLDILPAGAHTLTAQYSGDANYAPVAFGNYSLVVGTGDVTATSLSVASTTPIAGESVTFTANVVGAGHSLPTSGNVQFTAGALNIGSAPIDSHGVATLTTSSSLTPGKYFVVATFSGNESSVSSSSKPLSVMVAKETTTVALTAAPASMNAGQNVTLTAQIAIPLSDTLKPSGTVSFVDSGTTLATVDVADGIATYATGTLAVGSHSITATYSGDADFLGSISTASTVSVSGDGT